MIQRLNKRRDEEGFTLIELLIVIVILGILAAIVVFAVGGTGTNAAIAACKSDAASLETALEAYKAQQSPPAFPQSPAAQTRTDLGWAALLQPAAGASNTPYLRSVPPTAHYQLWWDQTNGAVYVIPPGGAYANPGTPSFDVSNGDACSAAK